MKAQKRPSPWQRRCHGLRPFWAFIQPGEQPEQLPWIQLFPLRAEEPPKDVKGLFLLTDYPAVSVRPGAP